MGDTVVADGISQRQRDVVLAAHLLEALRPVAPVEGLVADLGRVRVVGHVVSLRQPARSGARPSSSEAEPPGGLGGVRSSQVPCGTQSDPLRAAAFRP